MHTAYLLLGSNLGQREIRLRQALLLIERNCGRIKAVSTVKETLPCGDFADPADKVPSFLNQVVAVRTFLGPQKLMHTCLEIEKIVGRDREGEDKRRRQGERGYFSRFIDIDMLEFDALRGEWPARPGLPALILPHPRLRERLFARELLNEIKNKTA